METQKSVIFVSKKLKIKMRKIKNIVKLDILAIIPENIAAPWIAYLIQNIVYLKKFL